MPIKAARSQQSAASAAAGEAAAAPMDTLPNELLLHVFTFVDPFCLLTSAPGVCRLWRRLCGDTPGLHLDLSCIDEDRHIGQHNDDALGARMMSELAQRWKQAVRVTLSDVLAIDTLVSAMASQCHKLTHFMSSEGVLIGDMGAVSLAMHCPRLVLVDLGRSSKLTDVGLVALAEKCMQLVSITMSRADIHDAGVIALAKHCPLLATIRFPYCKQLTDVGALASCTQLTDVDFGHCHFLADADVISLAKHCAKLTSVNFDSCTGLTDSAVIELAKHCPLLANVRFNECAALMDAGIVVLSTHCAQLRKISLAGCVLLTSASVEAMITHCPLLVAVTLVRCVLLTDSAVVALAKHTSVKTANFSGCALLTNGAVVHLAVLLSKNPTAMSVLRFRDCHLISIDALEALRTCCLQLEFILGPNGSAFRRIVGAA
jgi:hypothetical protein